MHAVRSNMWAIVPVKSLQHAKQRLSPVLSQAERRQLLRAMLADLLNVLRPHPDISNILLVSDDIAVEMMARDYQVDYLSESELKTSGLNGSLQAAVKYLEAKNVEAVMILPGDLPLLRAEEISDLVQGFRSSANPIMVIESDRHGTGTNCLIFSPREAPVLGFGPGSFQWHCRQAQSQSMTVLSSPGHLVNKPGIRRDIDLPEDLFHLSTLQSSMGALQTRRFLAEQDISMRLLPLLARSARNVEILPESCGLAI